MNVLAKHIGGVLRVFSADCCAGVFWIDQRSKDVGPRCNLMQQFQPLRHHRRTERSNAGEIAPRAIEARDEAETDRVFAHVENNRYRGGRLLGRNRGGDTECGDDACRRTRSAARPGSASNCPSAKAGWMMTFWPSTMSTSLSPCRTALIIST